VMGGAQAGKVMRIVAEEKQRLSGIDPNPQMLDMIEMTTAAKLDSQTTALFNTAHGHDDGLIDPRDTRNVLIFVLKTQVEANLRQLHPISFGASRF
jgi:geranyl-CoA carboxylase beta subunit